MQVRITARHFQLNDAVKELAEERVGNLLKFFDNIIDAHLILEQEKHLHTAELAVRVYGAQLSSQDKSDDMRASIDGAVRKMERQIKKYKTKLKQKDPHKIEQAKETPVQGGGDFTGGEL
jgi:putative sigma-54 modulation protein